MSLRILTATAGRILRQLRHDRRTVALLMLAPPGLLTLLYFMFEATPQTFDRVALVMLGMFPFVVMFLITSIAMLRERRGAPAEPRPHPRGLRSGDSRGERGGRWRRRGCRRASRRRRSDLQPKESGALRGAQRGEERGRIALSSLREAREAAHPKGSDGEGCGLAEAQGDATP